MVGLEIFEGIIRDVYAKIFATGSVLWAKTEIVQVSSSFEPTDILHPLS